MSEVSGHISERQTIKTDLGVSTHEEATPGGVDLVSRERVDFDLLLTPKAKIGTLVSDSFSNTKVKHEGVPS